jgi:hypothetical protein
MKPIGVVGSHVQRSKQTDFKRREKVATPPTDKIFSEDEPWKAIGHVPIVETPPQDTISCADGTKDASRHEVGTPTPGVATPFFATPP